MKTNNTTLWVWIATMLLILVASCGKDGAIGPQGPQGEQGVQGIRGEKGEDGTTIFSGTVVPPDNLGRVGDFYFRTSNSAFYGPKTADGWGTPVNLRGATGAAGAAGSKILSGTGVPAANVGAVGDYYINSSNARLYGPKTASGWGTTYISLQGPTGPAGTANVIYSNWLSFQQAQRDTVVDGTNLKINHIPASPLTQAIIDRGDIRVYMRYLTSVFPLPYTSDAGSGTGPAKTSTVSFLPKPGVIYLTRYTHDNTASIGFGLLQFRYVLIPGGTAANANLQGIDINNYQAVKTALNLPD